MLITQNAWLVGFVRKIVAWPNRRAWLTFLSRPLMRRMANIAMGRVGTQPADNLETLFEQWSRASPALADYRFIEKRDNTVYAEIHSACALRGTSDVEACHRMMEYDREIMRSVGGKLVVLESQATPGRTFCRVALRTSDASTSDLIPAHELRRRSHGPR